MKSYFAIVAFLILLSNCKNRENQTADGGPCSYDRKIYPAEVIDTLRIDSASYEVFFIINTPNTDGEDTITYYSQFHSYLTKDEMLKNDIKPGISFGYEISEIKSGHCNPYIERLIMEKFKK